MTEATAVFRCDASVAMGSGHVMRCLTLADMIAAQGGHCTFVCRDLRGHLMDAVRMRGHVVYLLPAPMPSPEQGWLGVPLAQEISEFSRVIAPLSVSRIIVDHYGLDAVWETAVAPPGCPVMAIDDMADRPHACDILLDQNLGRQAVDYDGLVPDTCQRLIGPHYALLRPEFAAAREASLVRRNNASLQHILISMGGMDADNTTTQVLDALAGHPNLSADLRITAVMGSRAPHLDTVHLRAQTMPVPTDVLVDATDMAGLMSGADLAIGAAGSTSWERCCLGLPTLMLVLADNQRDGAAGLVHHGAAIFLGDARKGAWQHNLHTALTHLAQPAACAALSTNAATLCDGEGVGRVLRVLRLAANGQRPATLADDRHIWNWRYADGAVRYYRCKTIPAFDAHQSWLARALNNPKMDLRIFADDKGDAAHVRFDLDTADPRCAEIGICLDVARRGQGLGVRVLRSALATLPPGIRQVLAEVHNDNVASRRVFEKVGFVAYKRDGDFLLLQISINPDVSNTTQHFRSETP